MDVWEQAATPHDKARPSGLSGYKNNYLKREGAPQESCEFMLKKISYCQQMKWFPNHGICQRYSWFFYDRRWTDLCFQFVPLIVGHPRLPVVPEIPVSGARHCLQAKFPHLWGRGWRRETQFHQPSGPHEVLVERDGQRVQDSGSSGPDRYL